MDLDRGEPDFLTVFKNALRFNVQRGLDGLRALCSREMREVVNKLGAFMGNERLPAFGADTTTCKAPLDLRDMDDNIVFEAER